jgi:hypothetical protein
MTTIADYRFRRHGQLITPEQYSAHQTMTG